MSKYDKSTVSAAFQEVNDNPPKVVSHTAKKFGIQRAHKQKVAIALNKARRAGASLPQPKLSRGKRTA